MKKVVLLIISYIFLLCSCSDVLSMPNNKIENTVSSNEVICTTISSYFNTATTTSSEIYGTNLSDKELARIYLNDTIQAFINKNENQWVQHMGEYVEGKDGYFYNTEVENYKIFNESFTYNNIFHNYYYNASVELSILNSKDDRFPVGKSVWNIMMSSDGLVLYFLPKDIKEDKIFNLYYVQSELSNFGYIFSYSFNSFDTIENIDEVPNIIGKENFISGLKTFCCAVSPESNDGFGEYHFSQTKVNEIMDNYLGINNFQWKDNFDEGEFEGQLWKKWDMRTCYIIINEQTDEYIDMTYYADYVFLTPAKKMRYYFEESRGNIQLKATELLDDYGYEPNWYYPGG